MTRGRRGGCNRVGCAFAKLIGENVTWCCVLSESGMQGVDPEELRAAERDGIWAVY